MQRQQSLHDLSAGSLDHCQLCGSDHLELIIDLGHQPPCDSLLLGDDLNKPELTYPLRLIRCTDCSLVQIDYVVAPEKLFFREYPYLTGITPTLANNLQKGAMKFVEHLGVAPNSLVIDIGSNDGTLLKGFVKSGMRVLGIEPTNVAQIAIDDGIPTIQEFFSTSTAQKVKEEHGEATLITAANMFAHIPNLGDVIRGVSILLENNGYFITESHYLANIVETNQFDSVYHEHLKYYNTKNLRDLFEEYNFTLVDAERIPNYGGSIRAYARKGKNHTPSPRLESLVREEKAQGLYDSSVFDSFRTRIAKVRKELTQTLYRLREEQQNICGIGCPGRCSTLLNYCHITPDLLPYIAEQSTCLKLGMFLPGTHIPIVDEARIFEEQPDYALVLSWHYAEPIMKKLREKGLKSKFILPLPDVKIVT